MRAPLDDDDEEDEENINSEDRMEEDQEKNLPQIVAYLSYVNEGRTSSLEFYR